MWAKLMLLVWQHFIFSSAIDQSVHETAPAGFSTDVSVFLSENSSTTFSSSTPLATSLQNGKTHSTKVGRSTKVDAETSTVALNHIFQNNATTPQSTIASYTIFNSSVIVTSYSLNMTDSSLKGDNTTNKTDNSLTDLVQTISQHISTSREPTSPTNSMEHTEVTAIKVSSDTLTKPDASTTLLSSWSITSTEREIRYAAPTNSGTASIVTVCMIFIAVALLGVVIFLKKRKVFYSRLQEDNLIGSWSNYNNPVFEDA
ncbi:prostate androgen-regulated mucin-like protein 1 [Narcine bancroftii]|uniref:prostate androgen-regulated mucin-like protein 1 n=1 Tax=Narcine bancroftii TaxID=1343680 RepID=UPI0038316F44